MKRPAAVRTARPRTVAQWHKTQTAVPLVGSAFEDDNTQTCEFTVLGLPEDHIHKSLVSAAERGFGL